MSKIDSTNPLSSNPLSRRAMLGGTALVLGAGASALIATSALAKTPQKAAMYQDKPKDGKMCSACTQFEAPGSCKLVDGSISPDGWCQLFTPKAA